ncbi:MarR family winged helix-turn-helix transcriptional regulator [Streptosporangium sp. DT93]|uniref:MarR family winged helix-turn-helix transcriptional regulator n=1 Tax=Streptosporangium sp. DT93 TaxID=3393428 RepID=UPI003CF8C81C
MDMPPQERLGLHIKRVEQELMAAKHAALRPIGLTVPQYVVLYTLAGHPGISAAALARTCLVTPQTIATVLTNLQAKALITRRPHPWHRKVAEVQLTDEGRRVLGRADAEAVAIESELADAYTPEERARLIELLARASGRLAGSDRSSPADPSSPAGEVPA